MTVAEGTKPVRLVDEDETLSVGVDPELIGAVQVELEAFLGGTKLKVAELMKLQKGATITLDASLERDVELKLNGVTVARGELVAVDDQFGVRIVEIAK